MTKTQEKIAARLEHAFATHGFAELGVAELRAEADVSLRTLYKYFPSRDDMVLAALEHRHSRYITHIFDDVPTSPGKALDTIFDRMGHWMSTNAPKGCLFHNAVAAHPHSIDLQKLLERHKFEVADRFATVTGLTDCKGELMLLHEGMTQCWNLQGKKTITAAKRLIHALRNELSE